jgi:BirA family transcriptional regulator, biotin operon repressor / biotin---[acetyl-CoA-carboxylase] ligase
MESYPAIDLQRLDDRLEAAVNSGLLSGGVAHRIQLASRLADTGAPGGGRTGTAFVSGEALGEATGLSRAAVHKHIRHLQTLGFAVTAASGRGYRLESPCADLVAAEAVLPYLLGRKREGAAAPSSSPAGAAGADLPPAGLPYSYLEESESTNLVLREAIKEETTWGGVRGQSTRGRPLGRQGAASPPAGAVVVTNAQTAGRGRLDRTWWSQRGKDLTFSVLVRPSLAPGQAHLLSLAAGLTVAEVLETIPGFVGKAKVKWPNDVLLGEKKVCGILLEGSMDAERLHWAVVGIGLNVNGVSSLLTDPSTSGAAAWQGRPVPVSLREHTGREVPRAPLLATLIERLGMRWAALEGGSSARTAVLKELQRRDALAGRLVEVSTVTDSPEPRLVGTATGLGPEGQLLVQSARGQIVEVFAGDVTVRRVAATGSE